MCYNLFSVLACGCSHPEGVEYCDEALRGKSGKECPPEKRTARRHVRLGDPRNTRTCGKTPCPTQQAMQLARENDNKLQQAREKVAREYSRGERTPTKPTPRGEGLWEGDELASPSSSTNRNAPQPETEEQEKGKNYSFPADDCQGKDKDGLCDHDFEFGSFYQTYEKWGVRSLLKAMERRKSDGADSGFEPLLGKLSTEESLKDAQLSSRASSSLPSVAGPGTSKPKDSFDLGLDFEFEVKLDLGLREGNSLGSEPTANTSRDAEPKLERESQTEPFGHGAFNNEGVWISPRKSKKANIRIPDAPTIPPPPVFALPLLQGQGHDNTHEEEVPVGGGGAISTPHTRPGDNHQATHTNTDWGSSPIATPTGAIVRGEARNFTTPPRQTNRAGVWISETGSPMRGTRH